MAILHPFLSSPSSDEVMGFFLDEGIEEVEDDAILCVPQDSLGDLDLFPAPFGRTLCDLPPSRGNKTKREKPAAYYDAFEGWDVPQKKRAWPAGGRVWCVDPPVWLLNSNTWGAARRCLHCSATSTPQWRNGPEGHGTLCNACGIRYKIVGELRPEYRPVSTYGEGCSRKLKKVRKPKRKKRAKMDRCMVPNDFIC